MVLVADAALSRRATGEVHDMSETMGENTHPAEAAPATAAELREMLQAAEAREAAAAQAGHDEPAEVDEDPYPGMTHEFEVPCDEVLRAGRGTTIAMRLAEPCSLLGVILAEGFVVTGLKIAGKLFDEQACRTVDEHGKPVRPAYFGTSILGVKDNVELFVKNVSEQDRRFEGILALGDHNVVGWSKPTYSGAVAPGDDAQPIQGNPLLVRRGRRDVPPQPTAAVAAEGRYGGRSGPYAPPPPPDRSVPVRRPGVSGPRRSGGLVEGRPVTPGANEVALCITREQARKLYRLVVLGEYLAPFEKVDLQLPLEKALS